MLTENTNCPVVTVPTLVSPDDGSTVTAPNPTFTWNAVIDAVEYEFIIDNDQAFSSPAQQYMVSPTETIVSKTLPEALPNGTYYWRVRAKDSGDYWSDWSTFRSVIIFVLEPEMYIQYLWDYVYGTSWPASTMISLTIDDPSNGAGVDYTRADMSTQLQVKLTFRVFHLV